MKHHLIVLFYLKDYTEILHPADIRGLMVTDLGAVVDRFANDISWFGIVDRFITEPNGNEPLFWLYIKTFNILLFGNASLFVFLHYFKNITRLHVLFLLD
mgnify:CR=1 FL=1